MQPAVLWKARRAPLSRRAFLLAAIFAACLARPFAAEAQAFSGRVLFVADETFQSPLNNSKSNPARLESLYLVDLKGGSEKRLSPDLHVGFPILQAVLSAPKVNPQGTRAVYAAKRVIPDPGAERWDKYAEIWKTVQGQASYSEEMYYYAVAWSHWPEYLYTLANRNWSVVTVDLNTGAETPVTLFHWDELEPAWAPNGQEVVYTLKAEKSRFVVKSKDAENGKWRQYTLPDFQAVEPAMAPDGARLAYQSDVNGQWDLFSMIVAEDSRLRKTNRLTFTNGVNEMLPVWFPDARNVLFMSNYRNSSFYDFWKVNVVDGKSEPLYRDNAPAASLNVARSDPAISPDGRSVAFIKKSRAGWELALLDLETLNERTLSSGGTNRLPSWSPDGTALAFISDREGTPALFAAEVASGAVQRLSKLKAAWKMPAWTP